MGFAVTSPKHPHAADGGDTSEHAGPSIVILNSATPRTAVTNRTTSDASQDVL